MFGKLIKHEFRATARIMLPVLAALIVLAVLANISFIFIDSVNSGLLDILMGLAIAAYFICIFAACVVCIVIMIERFYHNVLCDQGYITMTLPTGIHSVIWSKLLVSLIWELVTVLVIILTLFFTVMTISNMEMGDMILAMPKLGEVVEIICNDMNFTVAQFWGLFIEGILLFVVCSIFTFLHFYSAMSLGHIFASHKVLLSVVFYFALNIAISVFSTGITLVVGYGMDHAMSSFGYQFFAYFLHYMLALSLVESVVLYFVTTISLKRGLNLA